MTSEIVTCSRKFSGSVWDTQIALNLYNIDCKLNNDHTHMMTISDAKKLMRDLQLLIDVENGGKEYCKHVRFTSSAHPEYGYACDLGNTVSYLWCEHKCNRCSYREEKE